MRSSIATAAERVCILPARGVFLFCSPTCLLRHRVVFRDGGHGPGGVFGLVSAKRTHAHTHTHMYMHD